MFRKPAAVMRSTVAGPMPGNSMVSLTDSDFNAPGASGYNESLLPYDLTRGGAPFVFADPKQEQGEIGFEVDLARELGHVLGIPCRRVQAPFTPLAVESLPIVKRGGVIH